MSATTIQKWGNSYAVRLPKAAVRRLNLRAGNPVEVHEGADERTIYITPIEHEPESLSQMLARITKRNAHRSVDWGRAVGGEVW